MTEYRLDVYDDSGNLQKQLTDFLKLSYAKRVNAPGLLTCDFGGNHSLVSVLADKWQMEVWRRIPGIAWYRDFTGIFRSGVWSFKEQPFFSATLPGIMSMLGWKIVAWYADTINRSMFIGSKAEDIMKSLAEFNTSAAATTANGRITNGAITGISIESYGSHGNTLDWYCAYDNLLVTLQKLALIAGGDFDLVKTGATTYEFRWYTGQIGTDRTATVKFSMELGNMAEPVFKEDRTAEKTLAVVGGLGEGSVRAIATRTGANWAYPANSVEMFVNATNSSTIEGLQAAGDQALHDTQLKKTFDFKVLQTQTSRYGVDYFLGDLITSINPFTGASYTQKITGIDITFDETGKEDIAVSMQTL